MAYRADGSTATAVKPTRAAPGPNVNGYFQGETVLVHDHMNMLTDEICEVVEQAGLTLDKSDDTQLHESIDILATAIAIAEATPIAQAAADAAVIEATANAQTISDGTFVSSTSGYQTFSSGLIIQWGVDTTQTGNIGSGLLTIGDTFPIAFPNACRSVQLTLRESGSESGQTMVGLTSKSTTAYVGYIREIFASAQNIIGVEWIAIGY
jgi:hypothetical protein